MCGKKLRLTSKVERRILSDLPRLPLGTQSGRRKGKKGVGCGSGRHENYGSERRDCGRIRIWDPEIKIYFRHHLEDKVQHLEETTFHKSNKVEETDACVEATVHKEKATTKKEETIKETVDTLTSLQSEVASLEAKGSVEKLPMELQLKNNIRGALETKDLKKMMIDLNSTLYDLQEPYAKNHWKEFMFIQGRIWDPGIKIYLRHHLEDKVVVKEWGMIRPWFG
ncbi:hypothetical protein Tco_0287694 [Tanacetum coccineum]